MRIFYVYHYGEFDDVIAWKSRWIVVLTISINSTKLHKYIILEIW